MKVRYIGPHSEGVDILAAGIQAPWGEPVDVDDELAKSLLEQEDNWERATSSAKKKPAKKRAAAQKASVGESGPEVISVPDGATVTPANNDGADAGPED